MNGITRSLIIDELVEEVKHLPAHIIELAVKTILEKMSIALESGMRIEIRGFGSFSLRMRKPRMARNPKTGAKVYTDSKYAVHFKPGKELRKMVDIYSIEGAVEEKAEA